MRQSRSGLSQHAPTSRQDLVRLAIGAIGVVYGDIGTSPLYAVKECFNGEHGLDANRVNVLGIISLIIWAMTLVISIKYLTFIMRADHNGEGGILALLARVVPKDSENAKGLHRTLLVAFALFGSALLYGDGIITPAISVLSAVEGLGIATHVFQPYVVPITAVILVGLFLVQRRGTGGIGKVFGPVTIVWFFCIGALGVPWILREPHVLLAFNPIYAIELLVHHKLHGLLVLGAVVLCITGGEALYADMGHFGPRPIRLAWFSLVFPALTLNYLGQGAHLMVEGARSVGNPFYSMVPKYLLYPVVAIATAATVIASQALISGAFSLTRQALQLGYLPRMTIVHTSGKTVGQIYIPEINWALMVACVWIVVSFGESSKLAAAYGVAVTGTMTITSILFYAAMSPRWGRVTTGLLTAGFLVIDLSFFFANIAKIPHGGWLPLVIAALIYAVMTTWKKGRAALARYVLQAHVPLEAFIDDVRLRSPQRVNGTAVFMSLNPSATPAALLHNFKHNRIVHEQVVILSVATEPVPEVSADDRLSVCSLGEGFFQVIARYGFMETPDVPSIIERGRDAGIKTEKGATSFFLSRETLVTTRRRGMSRWRKMLFVFLSKNARSPTTYFSLPANSVVELGMHVEL